MKEFKGHAAPWVAGEDWDNERIVIYSDSGIQPHVAYTPEWSIDSEQSKYNAYLIAAAPQLLEACNLIINVYTFGDIETAKEAAQHAINAALGIKEDEG